MSDHDGAALLEGTILCFSVRLSRSDKSAGMAHNTIRRSSAASNKSGDGPDRVSMMGER